MIKKPTLACIIFSISCIATAQNKTDSQYFYVGLEAGLQQAQDDSYHHQDPNGLMGGLKGGYQFTPELSLNLAYQYGQPLESSNSNTTIKSSFLTSSLRYDWWVLSDTSLYGQAGLTYASTEKENTMGKWNKDEVRPMIGFGVQHKITSNIFGQLGFQYIPGLGSGDAKNGSMGEYDSQALILGLTYNFSPKESQSQEYLENTKTDELSSSEVATHQTSTAVVYFAFDSHKSNMTPELNIIIDEAKKNRNKLVISGFTDESGPESYNRELSKKRAESVSEHLTNSGIDKKRLEIRALGELKTTSDKDAHLNRRVEVNLTNKN